MKQFSFLVFLVLIVCGSCHKTENENPADSSLEYYPLTLGKFVIYDVDSTVYTQLPPDTILHKYRIKEKIADEFTDNQGKTAYRLERSIKLFNPLKPYDSIPWTIKEVWMVNADNQKVQVVEGNTRFTKLVFPVLQNASWDGNANNNNGKKLYNYAYVDESQSISGIQLPQTLKVAEETFTTQISYDLESEYYARKIGLVYREISHLTSNTIVANVPVLNRITSGITYTLTLNSYGHE